MAPQLAYAVIVSQWPITSRKFFKGTKILDAADIGHIVRGKAKCQLQPSNYLKRKYYLTNSMSILVPTLILCLCVNPATVSNTYCESMSGL